MALGRLGRQTVDALGDYFLKSRKAVEESGVGRKEAKPAGAFLKEMQRRGVPEEEVRDLGLDEYDPKGARANERLTNEQMLSLIDARRERLEGSEVSLRRDKSDPISEPARIQNAGKSVYHEYVAEIGDPSTYEEVVVSRGRKPKIINSSEETSNQGLHFPLKDQLFHLRLNRSKSEEGEGVTNLIELQSDIQQRAQKGEPKKTDPKLPMKDNWEKLGMKEAIKYAVAKGDRYLAIPPSDETATAVGARRSFSGSTGKYVISKTADDVYNVEPVERFDLTRALNDLYTDLRSEGDTSINAFANPEALEDEDLLRDLNLVFDGGLLGDGEPSYENLESAIDTFISEIEHRAKGSTAAVEDYEFYKQLFDKGMEDFPAEEQMSYDEFMMDYVLKPEVVERLDEAVNQARELGVMDASDIADYSGDMLKGMLKVTKEDLDSIAESGRPVQIEQDVKGGGEGIMDFYDRKIVTEKRLKEYGVPLVEVVQVRPDGTKVKTKALDLNKFKGKSPKDIPYGLYSVAGTLFAGAGAMSGLSDQEEKEPQMFAEGGFVSEEDGMREAPVGALNEEVADDVEARLSEGEFVVPADVVRYIGLDKLMQMRQEAKAGLARMEQMGQMGNAEEAVISDNAPHQTMDEKLSFAQGGFVGYNPTTQAGGTPTNTTMPAVATPAVPSQLPTTNPTMYSPQQFQTAPAQSTVYNPNQFQTMPGQNQLIQPPSVQTPNAPTGTGGYVMRTYRGPNGDVVYIPFMNGQPQMGIPDGYTEIARSEATKPTTPKAEETPTASVPSMPAPSAGSSSSDSDNGGDTGGNTGGTGSIDSIFGGKKTAEDEALENFIKDNPDFKVGEGIDDQIERMKNRTGMAAAAGFMAGGPAGALMAGIKGLLNVRTLNEKRENAIKNSTSFNEYLREKGDYKALDEAATRRSQDMGTDEFSRFQEEQMKKLRENARKKAQENAEKKAREEAEAARQAAQRAASSGSRSDYSSDTGFTYDSGGYDWGSVATDSSSNANQSAAEEAMGYKKGGLIKRRSNK